MNKKWFYFVIYAAFSFAISATAAIKFDCTLIILFFFCRLLVITNII
jgi:hypothetical protein